MQTISFSAFRCKNSKNVNILKLSLVLLQDTDLLHLQVDQKAEDSTPIPTPLGLEERMMDKNEMMLLWLLYYGICLESKSRLLFFKFWYCLLYVLFWMIKNLVGLNRM